MANIIKPKRRSATTAAPTTAQLQDGEMAVNSLARAIYLRVGTNIVAIANYFSGSYNDLTDKPTSFPPSAHTHIINDVTGLQGVLNTKANVSGQQFTGTIEAPYVIGGTPSGSRAQLQSGGTSNAGYISFYNNANNRTGYIGNSDEATLMLHPEGGRRLWVNSAAQVSGGLGVGAVPNTAVSAVITNSGTVGTQQGHYSLHQSGNRIWQIGVETDRSWKLWSYHDGGSYAGNPVSITRDAPPLVGNAGGWSINGRGIAISGLDVGFNTVAMPNGYLYNEGNVFNIRAGNASSGYGYYAFHHNNLHLLSGGMSASGDIHANVYRSNNGNAGLKYMVGDDAGIHDIGHANTMAVIGAQNANEGYINFGNGGVCKLGFNGSWASLNGHMVFHSGIVSEVDFRSTQNGSRLGYHAQTISNWNAAVGNGWYMGADTANAPVGGWLLGRVETHNGIWTTQEVWAFTSGTNPQPRWIRNQLNGAWGNWRRIDTPKTWTQAGDPGTAAAEGDLWVW